MSDASTWYIFDFALRALEGELPVAELCYIINVRWKKVFRYIASIIFANVSRVPETYRFFSHTTNTGEKERENGWFKIAISAVIYFVKLRRANLQYYW